MAWTTRAYSGYSRMLRETFCSVLSGASSHSCFHRLDKKTGKVEFYTPEVIGRPPSAATAFANGPDGYLWLGFYTGGIARYKDGKFTNFTEKDGLPPGFIRDLFFDSQKHLWISTSLGGVARVDEPSGGQTAASLLIHGKTACPATR